MTITIELINKKAFNILQGLQDAHLIKMLQEPSSAKNIQQWKKKLRLAFKDMELHGQGKRKLKTLNELLDEL